MPDAIMSWSPLLISSLISSSPTTSLPSSAMLVVPFLRLTTPCAISSCHGCIGVILSLREPYRFPTVRERQTSGVTAIDDIRYKLPQTREWERNCSLLKIVWVEPSAEVLMSVIDDGPSNIPAHTRPIFVTVSHHLAVIHRHSNIENLLVVVAPIAK